MPVKISRDILLITDGEVWERDQIIAEARKSEHRVFSVGVGSSVAERLVRDLAEHSGGACEFVSPRENMATRIHRHFQRIHSPEAKNITVKWPILPRQEIRSSDTTVYDGDTVHVFAWFQEEPIGASRLLIDLPNGLRVEQSSVIREWNGGDRAGLEPAASRLPPMPARLAAAALIRQCDDDAMILAQSLAYQLVSKLANYIVVHERSEGEKVIETIKVKQTIAAGWHGMGAVQACESKHQHANIAEETSEHRLSALFERIDHHSVEDSAPRENRSVSWMASMDMRPAMDKQSLQMVRYRQLLGLLQGQISGSENTVPSVREILRIWGDHDPIAGRLWALVAGGHDEDCVVAAFFKALATSAFGGQLTRGERRLVEYLARKFEIEEALVHECRELIDKSGW